MKKKITYAVLLVLILIAAPSCEKKCSSCRIVTRTSGGDIVGTPGDPTEYCGASLTAFKLANPEITDPVTGNKTKVECN